MQFDPPHTGPRAGVCCVTRAEFGHCAHNGYAETPESIQAAQAAAERERAAIPFAAVSEDEWRRLDTYEAIRRLAAEVGGYQRLATMLRNAAHLDGQEVR